MIINIKKKNLVFVFLHCKNKQINRSLYLAYKQKIFKAGDTLSQSNNPIKRHFGEKHKAVIVVLQRMHIMGFY